MFSSARQPAGQELNACEVDPCFGAGNGRFEVLCQASVAVEPGQRAFDHPLAGQDFEPLCGVGSLDDLQRPSADPFQCVSPVIACTISESQLAEIAQLISSRTLRFGDVGAPPSDGLIGEVSIVPC